MNIIEQSKTLWQCKSYALLPFIYYSRFHCMWCSMPTQQGLWEGRAIYKRELY